MNCPSAVVCDFRSQRKCFSISASLLLMLLLLVAQCACRPPDELYENFEVGDDYADVDNVEWHHAKMVDGILREDHPIIMYKEDFVSEDYVPSKSNKTDSDGFSAAEVISATTAHPKRKYKDIAQRRRRLNHSNDTEHYRALKPEKMYFDALPPTPIVVTEADVSSASDYKFDPDKIRVEVISLVDEDQAEQRSKQLLSKRPKKYSRRMRRDVEDHVLRKRNPYLRHQPVESVEVSNYLQHLFALMHPQVPHTPAQVHVKHAVPGKLWNSLNLPVGLSTARPRPGSDMPEGFDNRFGGDKETDRVVWGSNSGRTTTRPESLQRTTTTPRPTRRTAPPLFHDARPENADTSFITAEGQQQPEREQQQGQGPVAGAQSPNRGVRLESGPPEQNPRCALASNVCCATTDLSVRFECFRQYSCARTIAHIISTCG